jgi:Rod binding domain-containing protein
MSDLSLANTASTALANTPITAPGPTKDMAAAKKAAQDFEAVFLNEFLGSMFQGVKTDGPFSGGPGEDMFRSLLLDQYSRSLASQGGFGLANVVQRQLISLQEGPK